MLALDLRKVCPRCGEEKDLGDFPRDRSRPSGPYPRCIPACADCNLSKGSKLLIEWRR